MRKGSLYAWWDKYRLQSIVFVTGAAILVIEITATRILSPFYGNTIYTVSSVISVILAALSVGYWKGGIRADAKPTFQEFYNVIFKGGISLFVLYVLSLTILPIASGLFSIRTGPLIWSMVLFFMPGYLLGMLSPFAIKLGHEFRPHMGLGTMSGNIFFWSTAGSILGSLLAGFVLIPSIGISAILYGTTTLIVLLGGCGLVSTTTGARRRDAIFFLLLLLIAITATFIIARNADLDPRIRYMKDGVYEKLTVLDSIYAGRPARFFLQDRSGSGAIFLDGKDLNFDYTKYYALYRFTNPELARALVIGGGIYTIPKAIHGERANAQIDVVEIEPELESIAKEYFDLTETTSIRTHTMDGRRFLRESKDRYDLIFSDVYFSLYSIPTHFTTREFFQNAKEHLAPKGIFMANIIGSGATSDESLLFSELRTMKDVFPYVYVFAAESPASTQVQNFIVVGMADQLMPGIEERIRTSTDPFLASLNSHIFPIAGRSLEQYDILTDDFAPVDHLVTRFIADQNDQHAEESIPQRGRFTQFEGANAMTDIRTIVALGSREIGSEGNNALGNLLLKRMQDLHIDAARDSWVHVTDDNRPIPLSNIIARYNPEAKKRIILGTHYDSISRAYRDKKDPNAYMPGANNSASGVALLLEAARTLSLDHASSTLGIDFVFFDGEEGATALGGGDPNWTPLGSTHFAAMYPALYLAGKPDHAVLFDMVCDEDLGIAKEAYSYNAAKEEQSRFWDIGGALAPLVFDHSVKHKIGDDHLPLIAAGIPSFLVIDFDYEPWFNTTNDTPSHCSANSLTLVGETLMHYLASYQ